MKAFLRFWASASLALSMGGVAFGQHYIQTNLQSNTSGIAEATDPKLVNPWGLTRTSASAWWVADNVTGVATLYNGPGEKQSLEVTIPPADPNNKKTPTGSPTGTVSNGSTTDFLLAPGAPAIFMFATIDGTIAAWNPNVGLVKGAAAPSTHAVTIVKTKDGSSYTGLTTAVIHTKRYLYAANFTKGSVDVYDSSFRRVKLRKEDYEDDRHDDDRRFPDNEPFEDERLPRHFVPFNVQAIGNDIVVTYVLHEEGAQFETDGPGLGYVDIYSSAGKLLQRLEHGNWLNAPWGVALAPLDFGHFSHHLLVGQFAGAGTTESSGFIAAYDLVTGKFDGLLEDAAGKPIAINGIWSLSPANVAPANADPDEEPASQIYFTAVPAAQGAGGLFGYLNAVPSELTEGSVQ
ncbi:MAG TPA: TIGR03118 family protein [Silvibacterium sp.]|nr:TIGR03118 family protein [Silvibacterium sp.]